MYKLLSAWEEGDVRANTFAMSVEPCVHVVRLTERAHLFVKGTEFASLLDGSFDTIMSSAAESSTAPVTTPIVAYVKMVRLCVMFLVGIKEKQRLLSFFHAFKNVVKQPIRNGNIKLGATIQPPM